MNTAELNAVLSKEIMALRSGQSKPEKANAITRAASQIISAARLELAYMKFIGAKSGNLTFFENGQKRIGRR